MKAFLLVTLVAVLAAQMAAPSSARAESGANDREASPAIAASEGGDGQAPAPPAPPAPAAPVPPAAPTPPPNYAYEPASRRDPFVSLVNRGPDTGQVPLKGARPEGVAGVLVEEVVVRGVVQTRGSWIAMIAAPNGRSYTIRSGDRLMDGSVRTISGQAVVLMQDVNDPLSLEKQREVRKPLRGEVK